MISKGIASYQLSKTCDIVSKSCPVVDLWVRQSKKWRKRSYLNEGGLEGHSGT